MANLLSREVLQLPCRLKSLIQTKRQGRLEAERSQEEREEERGEIQSENVPKLLRFSTATRLVGNSCYYDLVPHLQLWQPAKKAPFV